MRILLLVGVVVWHVENFTSALGLPASTELNSLEDRLANFTAKSVKIVANNTDNNLIYSPLSAWMVLTMATHGLRAKNRSQMCTVEIYPEDKVDELGGVNSMVYDVDNFTTYEVHQGKKNVITKCFRPIENFVRFTRLVFGRLAQSVNANDSDEATRIMKEWAADQPNNRFNELVNSGVLYKAMNLFLVNFVRFKSSWAHQFRLEMTTLMKFHIGNDKVIDVPTMRMFDYFVYGELPNAKATFVKIPFKVKADANPMHMFVILPNKKNGLAKLMTNFERDFARLFDARRKRNVNINLPKFKIKNSIDLKDLLIQMSSNDLFGTVANFTGFTKNRASGVKKFAQRSRIAINEAGSDAAIVSEFRSPPFLLLRGATINFTVDHPFVCVIAADKKIPLFTAIVRNPIE